MCGAVEVTLNVAATLVPFKFKLSVGTVVEPLAKPQVTSFALGSGVHASVTVPVNALEGVIVSGAVPGFPGLGMLTIEPDTMVKGPFTTTVDTIELVSADV